MNLKVIGLTQTEFKSTMFGLPDLQKRETDDLLIQPAHIVVNADSAMFTHIQLSLLV